MDLKQALTSLGATHFLPAIAAHGSGARETRLASSENEEAADNESPETASTIQEKEIIVRGQGEAE